MARSDTEAQEHALSGPAVHADWDRDYHTEANEVFFEQAFDRFLELIDAPRGAQFLDVGCGPCMHAMRLARRGYSVLAVDVSESVVHRSRETVRDAGFSDRIDIQQGSILELDIASRSQSYVLCWGVLMHVPAVEKAVAELGRVTAPGGWVVLSEANFRSFDDSLLRTVRRIRRRPALERNPAGVESWWESPAGMVLTRHADIGWLETEFAAHGFELIRRLPGQLTEFYTDPRLARVRPALHRLNRAWARTVPSAIGALGNILLLRKKADQVGSSI